MDHEERRVPDPINQLADRFVDQKRRDRATFQITVAIATVCVVIVLGVMALQGYLLHRQLDGLTSVMCQQLLIDHRNANEEAHSAIVHNEYRLWRHLGIPTENFELYRRENVVADPNVCGGSRLRGKK